MYCILCLYFTEQEECRIHGPINPEQRDKGCDQFIERSFMIVGSSGCCGLSGLPFADIPEGSETDD
jgi:hypothetical protein